MTEFTASGDKSPGTTADESLDDHADTSLDSCPRCGQPVATITVRGPADASYQPCGCRALAEEVA